MIFIVVVVAAEFNLNVSVAVGRGVKSGKKCLLFCHFRFCAAGTVIVSCPSLRRKNSFSCVCVSKFTP